jgi:phosphate transport system substrate-binding protein
VKIPSLRRVLAPSAAILAAGLVLTACSSGGSTDNGSGLSGTLNGSGSSAQAAAEKAWIQAFSGSNAGATVNYDSVGSGTGVANFLGGSTAFAGSDAYLSTDQVDQSKSVCGGQTAFEVPDYISPIAIVYNLPGVDKLNISPAVLANIYTGKITAWNDPAIAADNPGATLPSTPITPVHRSDKSGTTANFTDYLSQTSPSVWTYGVIEEWPGDITAGSAAENTSGIVDAVKSGEGSIGYADASQTSGMQVAAIGVGSDWVLPTAEASGKIADVSNPVDGRAANDLALNLNRTTTAAGTYPLVLVSYLIGCPTYSDQGTADLAKAYLSYVVSADGQAVAAQVAGSAPLPQSMIDKATAIIDAITVG